MVEYRFYPEGTIPPVSTFEFHEHRERAPHLEQPIHRDRLLKAAECVRHAADLWLSNNPGETFVTVSDLGCGDGGLLSLLADDSDISAWGYDFAPANEAGWIERGISAAALDVFGADREAVTLGDVVVMTEVLEHVADPHGVLAWLGKSESADYLVCSSPWPETPSNHDECHAWAWDLEGYRQLVESGGYRILRQERVSWFQVILAWKANPSVRPSGGDAQ